MRVSIHTIQLVFPWLSKLSRCFEIHELLKIVIIPALSLLTQSGRFQWST